MNIEHHTPDDAGNKLMEAFVTVRNLRSVQHSMEMRMCYHFEQVFHFLINDAVCAFVCFVRDYKI